MKTGKIRTSARQAAARQRISQIDDPSGSAPPFEQGAKTSGWIINPGRQEERRILETMITHLQDDPSATMDAHVLRFVYKEWPLLMSSMNTKTTVMYVKKKLEELNVGYIHRTLDYDWAFWSDYTIDGIFNITPPPDTQEPRHEKFGIQDTMSQSAKSDDANRDDSMTAADTQRHTKYHNDEDTTSNTRKQDTDDERSSDDNDGNFSDTDTSGQNRVPPTQTWQTEQLDSSDTDSDYADRQKTPHIPPLGIAHRSPASSTRIHTGHTSADRSTRNTTAHTKPSPIHSKIPVMQLPDIADDDGFLPVMYRKRHKHSQEHRDKDITDGTPPKVVIMSPQTPENPNIIDLRTPSSTDDRPVLPRASVTSSMFSPPTTTPHSVTEQTLTFSELLNDRIQEAMLVVDKRAVEMEARYTRYNAKLRASYRKQSSLRDKEEQRLATRASLLTKWEEKMTLRAQDLADMERRAILDLAQREQDLATLNRRTQEIFDDHKRHVDNLTFQSELAFRAWQEVETTRFKDTLAVHQSEYKARTSEFCEVNLQNLESNLDSYAEHARGIQEKLLVRMRKDIQHTYADTHHEGAKPHDPIPVDDMQTPERDRKPGADTATVPAAQRLEQDTYDPSLPPVPVPAHRSEATTTDRRWAKVDYEEILNKPSGVSIPASSNSDLIPQQEKQEQAHHQLSTNSKWADPDFQISQLRKTSTPSRIRGRGRKEVTVFYNSFVDFLKIHRVPIKILDEVRIDRLEDEHETLYPMELQISDPALHHRYSAAIYARLEEEDVLDSTEPLFVGLLQMFNSRRDGYALLKAILATTLMVNTQDLGQLSTPPTAQPGTTPYEFACSLNMFYRGQRQFNRSYTTREQATMYLQGMANDPAYTTAAQQLLHDIQQLPEHTPLPPRYCTPTLPLTLLAHPSAIHATRRTSASLNVTHGTPTHRASDQSRRAPDRDRSRSRERRPTSSDPGTRRQSTTSRSAGRPVPTRNLEIQCKACATNGHHHTDCRIFPKVAAILEYITNHPSDSKEALHQYRKAQHPENRKAARDKIIKVLHGRNQHGHFADEADIEALADQLTGEYWPESDDQTASICRLQTTPISVDQGTCTVLQMSPPITSSTLRKAANPIRLPDCRMMAVPRTILPPQPLRHSSPSYSPQMISSEICITQDISRIDNRRDLADTGASICATGMREILHEFTPITMYTIVGYDGTSTPAAGQGTAHILHPATNHIEHMFFVYVPSIRGTIVSLEHHARTHPRIHRWTQEATPASNSGQVTFLDDQDCVVSQYQTLQEQGLYYIQNLHFLPANMDQQHYPTSPQETQCQLAVVGATPTMSTPLPTHDAQTIKTGTLRVLDHIDFDHQLHVENCSYQLRQTHETHNPIHTVVLGEDDGSNDTRISIPASYTMERDVLNFETWHQRLAHCSEKRLRLTQKLVDGIPKFHTSRIPHVVTCRTCDVAKLQKAPRGPSRDLPPDLQPGQVFSMDIGFIRGPKNLAAVLARTEEAAPKVIESRQGYVCYLLIIDNKSRYTWPFPMKSKSVPLALIKTFLETHGNHKCGNRRIRTDGEGSLAESSACRTLLNQLGYTLEKTATDSSSQNGIAERPHQTFAAMVRCLLYSSSLPITFWADALVYANYINNRLYHSRLDGIPYTEWTGKRANMRHLRAFGAHVTVRRSGHRPTKADPHFYDGRFLRFGATERNIVYFDTKTKRDKLARHCAVDEFHYSTPTSARPHGAQALLDTVLPMHTPPADKEKDTLAPCGAYQDMDNNALHTPLDTLPPSATDIRRESAHTHHTATAAQLLGEERQQEILHLDSSTDMYSEPTVIVIPMNNLPTLGILTHTDDATSAVYVHGCQEGTKLSRVPRWRSTIKHSVIRSVDDQVVRNKADLIRFINEARCKRATHVTIRFVKPAITKLGTDDIPQLHFDQLRHINQMHIALREMDPCDELTDAFLNFTRAQLRRRDDYQEWRDSEWSQHDKYLLQDMFGEPIPRPQEAIVLPFVWTYMLKEDPITSVLKKKARATCNGGKKYGKAVTVAETYATCVEQPACRLYWSITARECLLAMGADAGNAFAEAPPATEVFYMRIDDQFREWWTEHMNRPPIPPGYVLPVNHALQGHPEAPRLWEKHIHQILVDKLHFTPTTHEKCLYSRRPPHAPGELQMILRQVDDFSVSAMDKTTCQEIIKLIGSHLTVPLNDLGIIRKFNGVNVQQTRWFVKLSCEDYILKILLHHHWQDLKASNIPLPMRSDSKYQRELELAPRPTTPHEQLQHQQHAGFSYRMAVGELIYALVVARLDISFAVIKLSQYGASPAPIHYQAIRHVFAYLNNTREEGLIYWRSTPRMDLPEINSPAPRSNQLHCLERPVPISPHALLTYSDSDWGSDASHRRSVTGVVILIAGAAVLYLTQYQKAVALSSTEAEFVAASEAGKRTIYLRSILADLGFTNDNPTQLFIDNTGAVFMVDAGAPTKRTRHVDIRYFALLDWSDSGQIKAEAIPTDENISDSLTKATGRIKFHQHADLYMGRTPPQYVLADSRFSSTHLHITTFHSIPVPLETLSALHHPILSAFTLHSTDISETTEHGRVRGYSIPVLL